MLTFLGALLVIGSCFILSLKIVQTQKEGMEAVDEFSNLLKEMAEAIEFQLEPLPRLLKDLAEKNRKGLSPFLKEIETAISNDECCSINALWEKALKTFAKSTKLPEKAFDLLSMAGNQLGKMDVETETNRLKTIAGQLKELYIKLEKDISKTEKLTRSLGLLLGGTIVILLI